MILSSSMLEYVPRHQLPEALGGLREEIAAAMQQAGFSRVRFHRFPVSHAYLAVWGHILEARP